MRWIDRYAYSNRIRKLDPAYKAGLSFGLLLLCLFINRIDVCLAVIGAIFLLAVFWAGLPARFLAKVILAEGGFLCFGVLGVAVSISPVSIQSGWHLGPVWIDISPSSVSLALNLLFRSLSCVAAMNFLALTTPLVDLIDLGKRMHMPVLLADLMTLIYRYIFTLLDCMERMVIAKESKLGFNGMRNSLRSAADIAAQLFIEAFQRSQRLQTTLESRGWEGSLNVIPQEYEGISWPWQRSRNNA